MKKSKLFMTGLSALALILILTAAKCGEGKSGASTANLSANIINTFKSDGYHMVTKTTVQGMEIVSDAYYKNGMTSVTTDTYGVNMTAITKDGKVYSVMHDMKMYMILDIPANDESANDKMYYDGQVFTGTGRDMFDGKERVYEEYTYDKKAVIRYFFDGGDFAGIAVKTGRTTFVEMVVLSFSNNVPANAFDIPNGYTEIPGLSDLFKGFNF